MEALYYAIDVFSTQTGTHLCPRKAYKFVLNSAYHNPHSGKPCLLLLHDEASFRYIYQLMYMLFQDLSRKICFLCEMGMECHIPC